MSRVGKKPIEIAKGVDVTIDKLAGPGYRVSVKGPKGQLVRVFPHDKIKLTMEGGIITVERLSNLKSAQQLHGTVRAHINNMVTGVSTGFKKLLLLTGVGYRAVLQGNKITFTLGYSHPIEVQIPSELKVATPKDNRVEVEGYDKELLGAFCHKLRYLRDPNPYSAKGVSYDGEIIRRKPGKAMAKGA